MSAISSSSAIVIVVVVVQDQKKKIERLESSVARSKEIYSQTLRALESISDEIHEKRGSHTVKRQLLRRTSSFLTIPPIAAVSGQEEEIPKDRGPSQEA